MSQPNVPVARHCAPIHNLGGGFSCKLCWKVTVGVFLAILLVEGAILFFSIKSFERDRMIEVEREAVVVMRAILRSSEKQDGLKTSFPDTAKLLSDNTVLVGARVYDQGGPLVSTFGEQPEAFESAIGTATGTLHRSSSDGSRMDVVWPPDRNRLPYYVTARINTTEIEPAVTAFKLRIVGLVLLISVFVTIVTMLVLERVILIPIRHLRDRLLAAGSDPENPDCYVSDAPNGDELGDVIKAFNRMLRQAGENLQRIKVQERELTQHRDRLEVLVSDRTTKFEKARKEAEHASQAKSEFLAHMSHELRTPLNAIIGFSQMWVDQVMGPIQNLVYLDYAKDINNSGKHLLRIIGDILDLNRIEAGEKMLELGDIKLEPVIADCLQIVAPRAERYGVQTQASLPSDMPMLRVDEQVLKQIILNIVGNALKFTESGGELHINAIHREKDGVGITISDTGIGIPPEELLRVMEAFEQARDSSHVAHSGSGTGLGLPLAKRLTELHGGRLGIESVVGQGTTVTIALPAKCIAEA